MKDTHTFPARVHTHTPSPNITPLPQPYLPSKLTHTPSAAAATSLRRAARRQQMQRKDVLRVQQVARVTKLILVVGSAVGGIVQSGRWRRRERSRRRRLCVAVVVAVEHGLGARCSDQGALWVVWRAIARLGRMVADGNASVEVG